MLKRADDWLKPHRDAVWDGLYRREEQLCREALQRAWSAWSEYELNHDLGYALRLYLDFLEFQVEDSFVPRDDGQRIRAAIQEIAKPTAAPLARVMRARTLITLRCWAHWERALDLGIGELNSLFREVDIGEIDGQGWTFIAYWAFDQREAGYLSLAFETFITQPLDYLGYYSKLRLGVMLALVEGDCKRQQLEHLIDETKYLHQLQWIEARGSEAAAALGLWDSAMQAYCARRRAELERLKPLPPRHH